MSRRGRRGRPGPGTARYVAPAAFLVAATIAILLIRSGLNHGGGTEAPAPTVPSIVTTAPTTTGKRAGATTATTGTTPSAPRFYTIKSGDTYQQIALDQGTSVDELKALNPGVDPAALTVGQKIRIG